MAIVLFIIGLVALCAITSKISFKQSIGLRIKHG